MAIVGKFGKPDLFITMTCNPKWEEITKELREGEKVTDRPDLTSRVFLLKLEELKNDIIKEVIFGEVLGYCIAIEFQKRGLPHAHILLILKPQHKPQTCDAYDNLISAEIPNPLTHPRLHAIVTTNMIHGPCGDLNPNCVCMNKSTNTCTKQFPKNCQDTTTDGRGTYPDYRRRNLYPFQKGNIEINDSWVVPYNKGLLYKYNCHINVEICNSVTAVKYLFKYIFKGPDRAAVNITVR
jgi:hypothetical protein